MTRNRHAHQPDPKPKPEIVHLWTICPDCGHVGAHHSYTDRGGESVGVRCG